MTSQPRDLRPTCSVCGSHDVEEIAWTAYRTDGTAFVVSSECPYCESFCHHCDAVRDLTHPRHRTADHRRAERNETAREAGPELLAAARQALAALSAPSAGAADVAAVLRRAIAHAEGREHA
jgi:hypothetical protein